MFLSTMFNITKFNIMKVQCKCKCLLQNPAAPLVENAYALVAMKKPIKSPIQMIPKLVILEEVLDMHISFILLNNLTTSCHLLEDLIFIKKEFVFILDIREFQRSIEHSMKTWVDFLGIKLLQKVKQLQVW